MNPGPAYLTIFSTLAVAGLAFVLATTATGAPAASTTAIPVTDEPVAPVGGSRCHCASHRQTAAAALFATNALVLTEEAPPGPSATPDLRVFHFERPQRVAGNGVITEGSDMGQFRLFRRANEWTGYLNNQIVQVVACEGRTLGGAPTDEGRLLVSFFARTTSALINSTDFTAPSKTGGLAVVDAEGTHIVLVGTMTPVVVFDLATLSFLPEDKVAVYAERKIGDATFLLSSPGNPDARELGAVWQISLGGQDTFTIITLASGGVRGDWSLQSGSGSTVETALRAAKPIADSYPADFLRVFDVRKRDVFFVNNSRQVLVYNLDSGYWSNGDAAFSIQPDFLATVVPDFNPNLEGQPIGTPVLTPASVQGYP